MIPLITIQITEADATEFRLFQKYYVAFKMLDSVGAFNIKDGSITLDFDSFGQIKGIRKNEMYRPKSYAQGTSLDNN